MTDRTGRRRFASLPTHLRAAPAPLLLTIILAMAALAACTGADSTGAAADRAATATYAPEEAGSATPKLAGVRDGHATPSFKSVSVGGAHTCGVKSDGSVACWGAQARGVTASDFLP